MFLILLGIIFTGVIGSKILFELGLRSIRVRYLIAVSLSYLAFFVWIRLWLWYISDKAQIGFRENSARTISSSGSRTWDVVGVPDFGSGHVGSAAGGSFGGGGDFGGAGAGGSWANGGQQPVILPIASRSSSPARSSTSHSGLGSMGDVDDGKVLAVIALIAVIAAIFGAGIYVVYQAPAILSEVGFHGLLASGLVRASRRIHTLDWAGSVFKATWIPFGIVLVLIMVFTLVAHQYCPQATKLPEVVQLCSQEQGASP
jgi:hypothetical protein